MLYIDSKSKMFFNNSETSRHPKETRTAQFESSDILINAWNNAGTTNGVRHSRSTSFNARSARILLARSAFNSSSNRASSKYHVSLNNNSAHVRNVPSRKTSLRSTPVFSGRTPILSRSSKMTCSRACIAVSWRRVSHNSRVSRFSSRSRRRGAWRSPLPDEEELG